MACAKLALSCTGLLSPWAPRLAVPRGAAGAGHLPSLRLRPNTPMSSPRQLCTHSRRRGEPCGSRASPLFFCSPHHYFPTSSSFLPFFFFLIMHFAAFLCPDCYSLVSSSLTHLFLSLFSFTSGSSETLGIFPSSIRDT